MHIIKCLTDHGADINCENFRAITPLHIATENGNLSIIEYPICHEANINCKTNNICEQFKGFTPLHMAVFRS